MQTKHIRKLLSIMLMLLFTCHIQANEIHVFFPNEAWKEYVLYFYYGQKTDSVSGGRLDINGKAHIKLPPAYCGYKGIAFLAFKGEKDGGVNLVINDENFSISSGSQSDIIFGNSPENNYLVNAFKSRTSSTSDNDLYASRYLKLLQYNMELKQKQLPVYQLRNYLRRELDIEALYTSGLWNHVISGTFGLYPDMKNFGIDMAEVLKQTKEKQVFNALAEDLISICNQFGWETAQDTIVSYLVNSKRIPYPQGNLHTVFEQHKVRPGVKAPALICSELQPPDTQSERIQNRRMQLAPTMALLVFYETGCGNCDIQMNELIKHYDEIKHKGYEVVSIAADIDEDIFESSSHSFPWQLKLCDYEGFAGKNFVNYGIIGTPTIYIIDEKGIVKGRYARLEDVIL